MAKPNPQLQAALAQFAAQLGTTAEQEAQLRAAITADGDRLTQFNQQAAAGQLKAFAMGTPGSAPNPAGAYDKSSGVVTLPATSFQAGSTAATADLKAVLGVQALSVDFAQKTWQDAAGQTQSVSQDMVGNLQATLNGSPLLASQIKAAVTQGHVRHFSLLDNSMSAGATYDGNVTKVDGDPKGINLPVAGLQTKTATNPLGKYDAIDMTFVLGHEIQHGFNDASRDQRRAEFLKAVSAQSKVKAPEHDYTDELRNYIQAGREDEAKAHIAGWNALLSRERQGSPAIDGTDLMLRTQSDRVLDFIHEDPANKNNALPKPNLTFNQDGSLAMTAAEVDAKTLAQATAQGKTAADIAQDNVAGMGQNYFNRPSPLYTKHGERPVNIGEHKDQAGNLKPTADYTNLLGTWALEQIVAAETRSNATWQGAKPKIAIDMAGVGLKEDLIELEGLDLGTNKTPRPYLDTSQTPAVQGHFHHTQDGSVNPQHDHQHVPVAPSAPETSAPRSPADKDHPNHGMLESIRTGVGDIDTQLNKPYDAMSECLSRSLLAECKSPTRRDESWEDSQLPANALTRVDHVVMSNDGRHIFAVEGALTDPKHKRAAVEVETAIRTPVEVSDARLETANLQIAQQVELARQQTLTRGPDDPTRGGQTQ